MPLFDCIHYTVRTSTSIYLAPTADARDTWPALSHENSSVRGEMFRLERQSMRRKTEPTGLGLWGEVLGGPLWKDEDGMLTIEVDLDDCLRGRLDLDVAGSRSR